MATRPKCQTAFLRDPDLPFLEARDSRICGSPFGMHTHRTYAVALEEAGSTMFDCRGGLWLVNPGTVVFLPPGEPHACNPRRDGERKYRMYYFERAWFEGKLRAHSGPKTLDRSRPAILDDPAVASALAAFAQTLDRNSAAGDKNQALDEALSLLFSSRLVRHIFGGQPRAEHRAARMAASVIAERPADRISLGELANACGVGVEHLTRIFRRAHGVTPHAYQNQLRVELAKRLLAQGTPIAQAAVEAGFTDQSHLNRIFRRYLAATPRQYSQGSRPAPPKS